MKMHFSPAFGMSCLPGSPSPNVSRPRFGREEPRLRRIRGCHQPCSGKRQAGVTRTECQPRLGLQSVPSATQAALLGGFNRLQQRRGRWRAVQETMDQPGREKHALVAEGKNSASGDPSCIICMLCSQSRCSAGSLGNAGKGAVLEDSSQRRATG